MGIEGLRVIGAEDFEDSEGFRGRGLWGLRTLRAAVFTD